MEEGKGLAGGGGSTTTTSAAQPVPAHAGRVGERTIRLIATPPLRNGGRPEVPPGGVVCGTGEDAEGGAVSDGAEGDEVSSSHGYCGSDVAALGGNDVVVNDGSVDEPADPSPNSHEKSPPPPLPLSGEFDDPPSLPAMSRAAATIQSPINFVGGAGLSVSPRPPSTRRAAWPHPSTSTARTP